MTALRDAHGATIASAGDTLLMLRDKLRIHPLQGFELEMLGRLLRDEAAGVSLLPLLRVAIVSGFTSEPLANALRVALLAIGFRAEVYEAPFGVYRQEILSPNSDLYAFNPQVILIVAPAKDIINMPEGPVPQLEVDTALKSEVEQWKSVWAEIKKKSDAVILQHTFEMPDSVFLGIAERRAVWGPARFILELNHRLIEESAGSVHWVDVDNLAGLVGRNNWHDPRLKYHGKFAFSSKYLAEYCKLVEGVLRIVLAQSRKALILDLDNTLWGGIIGDDGLDGIQLGPDSPEGEAYLAFCHYVADLGRRGVILGICSKNDMKNVAELFEKHRHMPLNLDDFAVVRCNWDDKASNLASIASELNIDPSAIVFVDDNPAECELVRQTEPAILVIHLDGDPASFVRRLDRERLFDSQGFSTDDLKRSQSYQARTQAVSLRQNATDLESYLSSMEMKGEVWTARQEDILRLTQMEAKTNQFNLTTRRWTSDRINGFMANDNYDVLCFSLVDRFADHGLVGSMVVSYMGTEVRILSWLLSCRVFSRTCEEFMLTDLVRRAMNRGATRMVGEFIATGKNGIVSNLLTRLGFVADEDKSGIFVMNVSNATLPRTFVSGN